jgi:hypothetical protein
LLSGCQSQSGKGAVGGRRKLVGSAWMTTVTTSALMSRLAALDGGLLPRIIGATTRSRAAGLPCLPFYGQADTMRA